MTAQGTEDASPRSYPRHWEADVLLRDGGTAHIRPIRPDDREVLLLTYWDGFSSTEVSDLLNTSATAVRMRLHRARKALSHLLATQTESEGAER